MGTVVNEAGFEIKILTGDHEPPHVHVYKAGKKAKITIGDSNNFPTLIKNTGMNKTQIAKSLSLVKQYQDILRDKWTQIYGK